MAMTADVLRLLDIAEETWRDAVRTEFPLFADTPVKKARPNPKGRRHWMFYTDKKVIHTDILKPDMVRELFEKVVKDVYRDAYGPPVADDASLVERLVHDTLAYLHFHEVLHPAVCPDSDDDDKRIDEALFEGIHKAEPALAEDGILRKVGNVRNAVWDIGIDDLFFSLSNFSNSLERRIERVLKDKRDIALPSLASFPDGVVPIFDLIEVHLATKGGDGKEPEGFKSLFYPITRLMYGLLFTKDAGLRKRLVDFFKGALSQYISDKELRQAVTSSLKGAVRGLDRQQLNLCRLDPASFDTAVDALYDKHGDAGIGTQHREVVDAFTKVFSDKRTRYSAIKGFIQPLARYISLEREEKRHGTHISDEDSDGSGQQDSQSSENQGGGNMQQALLNLADVLGQQQANSLLSQVANSPGGKGGQALRDRRLSLLATDEYYKRNAKEISIRSPRKEAVRVDLGKRQQWVRTETHYIQVDQLHNLPLERILQFQQETGITQLFQLSDHEWRYDVYELEVTQEFDFTFESRGLELPDNIVFHLDSSSSMGDANYVGTGSPYDRLMHVVYGILKPVYKASVEMKKDVNVIAANFSNGTIVSDRPSELKHLYDTPFNDGKKAILGFQGGGTYYDVSAFDDIKKKLKPGKTVHVWITDGELAGNCAPHVYNGIEGLVQDPDVTFLYFETGQGSAFGGRIKALSERKQNVKHHPNVSLAQIQSSALEVVLQYDDKKKYTELL